MDAFRAPVSDHALAPASPRRAVAAGSRPGQSPARCGPAASGFRCCGRRGGSGLGPGGLGGWRRCGPSRPRLLLPRRPVPGCGSRSSRWRRSPSSSLVCVRCRPCHGRCPSSPCSSARAEPQSRFTAPSTGVCAGRHTLELVLEMKDAIGVAPGRACRGADPHDRACRVRRHRRPARGGGWHGREIRDPLPAARPRGCRAFPRGWSAGSVGAGSGYASPRTARGACARCSANCCVAATGPVPSTGASARAPAPP